MTKDTSREAAVAACMSVLVEEGVVWYDEYGDDPDGWVRNEAISLLETLSQPKNRRRLLAVLLPVEELAGAMGDSTERRTYPIWAAAVIRRLTEGSGT